MLLPSLSECLSAVAVRGADQHRADLQSLDLWLTARGDATISVGVVSKDDSRRCTVMAHDQTFSASSNRGGFAATWEAIVGATRAAELFESQRFPS